MTLRPLVAQICTAKGQHKPLRAAYIVIASKLSTIVYAVCSGRVKTSFSSPFNNVQLFQNLTTGVHVTWEELQRRSVDRCSNPKRQHSGVTLPAI